MCLQNYGPHKKVPNIPAPKKQVTYTPDSQALVYSYSFTSIEKLCDSGTINSTDPLHTDIIPWIFSITKGKDSWSMRFVVHFAHEVY